MKAALKVVLFLNLAALAVLTLVFPHLMLAPGKLIPGHRDLEANCFACHTPFLGAASERCVNCHKAADIGRLTTRGAPLAKPLTSTPFHQKLARQDCVACHSDHAGVKRLRQAGRFDHELIQPASRSECQSCHRIPSDPLHQKISGNCGQCHSQVRWTPASFDHAKHFVLDRDHNVKCSTCHLASNYANYTCYGCHEHTPEKIRRKHIEEGIRDFKSCVQCHRSADEHDIRWSETRTGAANRRVKSED